jgi:hypothetical protein
MTKRQAGTGNAPYWDGRRWVAQYMDGGRRRAVTNATPGRVGKVACAAARTRRYSR